MEATAHHLHYKYCGSSRMPCLMQGHVQVFWIIIGTGSVQLISFTSMTATSEPASTAKATTQQYGRRLLQASAPSSNGSIPAENVVFAVTLPSASQNSLLVLQSSSGTVRQQFAGWFVTQMQARGKLMRCSRDRCVRCSELCTLVGLCTV